MVGIVLNNYNIDSTFFHYEYTCIRTFKELASNLI